MLLIPQRYEFSSKSQQSLSLLHSRRCCCWYHKGTNFQANHNLHYWGQQYGKVVADTTKVRIFKQITTPQPEDGLIIGCCWYHKGTNFQANHNHLQVCQPSPLVVADTTKVRIFKQITTECVTGNEYHWLLLIPQRYEFSSKSQPNVDKPASNVSCCWYHKGTNFQANHNENRLKDSICTLLLIPQRYEFSSKSQLIRCVTYTKNCCCWYHKGTNFQANHNAMCRLSGSWTVVADTTKVRIFKQITTWYL